MINTKGLQFQKYCKHCKYMKSHKGYAHEVFNSKYFDRDNELTLPQVLVKYNISITQQTVYNCLKKHFPQYNPKLKDLIPQLTNTVAVIDGDPNTSTHEQALDEFIATGKRMVQNGEMVINPATYISAIKTKADIEKSSKDRKLEMMKAFFSGQTPSK